MLRKFSPRIAMIVVAVMLVAAGAVMTATAAPGPATDVKTAGYGGGTTLPGPCKNVKGEATQAGCVTLYNDYVKAKNKCKKKKTKKARKKCLAKVKKNQKKELDEYVDKYS